MPSSDLVSYIQEQTQEGISAQTLRESLMEAGWQELDIENAFHDVAAGMDPATPGASIHEDLAQVRGMVAHLASRVRNVEATLASVAALPSAFIGPEHELTQGTGGHAVVWRVLETVIAVAVAAWAGVSGMQAIRTYALAQTDQAIIVAALGFVVMVSAVIAMLWHRAWGASLLTACAVALWGVDVFAVWHSSHPIGWTVATALGVFLLAIIAAMGRWIDRLRA